MRSKLFVFIFCVSFSKLSYADNRYFGELRYINPIFSTGDNQDNQPLADARIPSGSKIFTEEEENYGIALGFELNKNHSLAISFEDKDTQWRQNNFTSPAGTPNYNYIFRDLEIQNLLLEYNYIIPVKNWFKFKGILGAGLSHLETNDITYYDVPGLAPDTSTDTPGAGVYDFSHKFGFGLEARLTGENYINLSWVRTNYGKAEANKGNFRPATETEIIEEQIILGIKKYF